LLVGSKVVPGIAFEMIKSESNTFILDGWSIDCFGGKERLGVGVSKDLIKKDAYMIDAGVYATKKVIDLLTLRKKPEIMAGISVQFML